MSRFVIKKAELLIFFNALIDLGLEKNLAITVPLLKNLRLCKLELGEKGVLLEQFIPSQEYEAQLSKRVVRRETRREIREEFADYPDLVKTLYQSGILAPSGLSEIEGLIQRARSQSLIKGGDVFYLALDTNTVRDRLFSNYLARYLDSPNVDFVLCEVVREELTNRRDKIQKGFLQEFRQVGGDLVGGCFRNQNRLEDRLRYIGYLEYNRIRDCTGCEQLSPPAGVGRIPADELIIDLYSQFARMGRKVVLLSRDNELIRMSTGLNNVIPMLLEQDPFPRLRDVQAPWDSFLGFLSLLGNLYGRIDISMGESDLGQIYGVWSQKDAQEWEQEMLRLQIEKDPAGARADVEDTGYIIRTITDHLEILGKIGEVG